MNWTQFLLSLAAVYSGYYLLNVLFDLLRSRGQPSAEEGQDELVFSEEHQPRQVSSEQPPAGDAQDPDAEPKSRQAISSGPLQSTGGVSLKQLFSLAQSDLIEYTKAIPY
ncbi:hypothetical protein BDE36_1291 [Arcticibacter tournemirensis]|uniref:Uncharacterized protein n=1 Tax=Arcticibacter tournemirensis TaxID=699437 RepID=A0A5M9GVL4_9SPHI|nr:hypothetical protein [Arcticibacter tournemirensis]KAA8476854.1 hypothetical protein F1649_19460 [Arcticibacter tournemirensis]TQM49574.1 hypothetical protein BDE36_1291 [Arcticibacter tournemirensis]